jgi:hypothetical protein
MRTQILFLSLSILPPEFPPQSKLRPAARERVVRVATIDAHVPALIDDRARMLDEIVPVTSMPQSYTLLMVFPLTLSPVSSPMTMPSSVADDVVTWSSEANPLIVLPVKVFPDPKLEPIRSGHAADAQVKVLFDVRARHVLLREGNVERVARERDRARRDDRDRVGVRRDGGPAEGVVDEGAVRRILNLSDRVVVFARAAQVAIVVCAGGGGHRCMGCPSARAPPGPASAMGSWA